jgi:hypothetical protein
MPNLGKRNAGQTVVPLFRRPAELGLGLDGPACPERGRLEELPNSASTRWRLCNRCHRVTTRIDLDGIAWCGGSLPSPSPNTESTDTAT